MSTKTLWTVAAACAVALLATGTAKAQQEAKTPAYQASGTSEQRKAERSARKASTAAAEKKGPVGQSGEAEKTPAYKASGTSPARKAERSDRSASMTEAEKKGQVAPAGQK